MIIVFLVLLSLLAQNVGAQCPQCSNRGVLQYSLYPQQQKKYNFNFEQFFSQFPGFKSPQRQSSPTSFSSLQQLAAPQRIFSMYGQEADSFGSAIGKSIGQRIQQELFQLNPIYDAKSTAPSSPSTSSSTSYSPSYSPSTPLDYDSSVPSSSASSTSYSPSSQPSTSSTQGSSSAPSYSTTSLSSYSPSSYSSASWRSTHPPEDLPTVQEAFQQQQQSYGTTQPIQFSQIFPSNINGFGGLPGPLPLSNNYNNNRSDCPWCQQGFRSKRDPEKEKEKESEEKKNEKI